jgi:hypothetical protein
MWRSVIDAGQLVQGIVQSQQFGIPGDRQGSQILESDPASSVTFGRSPAAGVVHKDLTHEPGSNGDEMSAVLQVNRLAADKSSIGLVNQGGALEGVIRVFQLELVVSVFRFSWKWRRRSPSKVKERTHEEATKHYTPEEKVVILRRHLLEKEPISKLCGKIERWHQSLKGECIRPGTPLSLDDARRPVSGYVDHYNNVRLNSAAGYITPKDMLAGRQQEIHAERDRKLEAARKQRRIRRQ